MAAPVARCRWRGQHEQSAKNVLVVDASVLASALGDDGTSGDAARARLLDEELTAPELIDLEVLSVLRRQRAAGSLDDRRSRLALDDLRDLPLERVSHRDLLWRAWELRDNLTVYGAAYVALAEVLGVTLLTADAHLVNTPGARCVMELLRVRGRGHE